ncbi:hypothetical protein [Reinekea sp.]|uniref:hypothetical protein n=1 Tax=Reinekea sp. TaxID=1970455 RepID=UPI003988B7D0
MKHAFPILLAGLVTTACQTQQVDNSPKVAVAKINAEFSINGSLLPDFYGEQVVYTTPEKRSIRDDIKFDSFLMKWANSDEATIARLDLNKAYSVDYKKERYSECELSGCNEVSFLDQLKESDESDDTEEYQDYEELGCQVDLVTNDFNVTQTGKKRKLNGFDVEQYQVLWTTEYQDTQGQKDVNLISFDFWTTTPNANINEVWDIHGQFQDSISKTVTSDPLVRLLGPKGYKAIAAFTGDTNNQENQFGGVIGKELAKVKGYPISIKFEWTRNSQACQAEKQAQSDKLNLEGGIEGVGKQLLGNFAKKSTDKLMDSWKKKPLVRYVYEIKSVAMATAHESNFDVPAGYDLVDRQ